MNKEMDWETISLNGFINLINGFAFQSYKFTEEEGMPLIRIRDLGKQNTELNFKGKYDELYLVKKNDLLVGMDGDFATIKWKGNDALLNQRVCKITSQDQKKLDQDFLYYRLINEIAKINHVTAATTVKHLSSKDILGIRIELPPICEQSKIAEILSTVDRAIEQTEALIAKQQRIKTGLMQDLLTRGIDEHGNIRSEQTHKFKDSLLGRIPVEWEVERLGTALRKAHGFLQTGPFGSQLHAHEYVYDGIPVIMPQDILFGEVCVDNIARILELRANDLCRHRVQLNDIVFSRRGDLTRAAAINERENGWVCGTGCFLLRVPIDMMDSRWLVDVYRHHRVQLQIDTNAVGSTMPSLNNGVMEQLLIAFPNIEEQQEITRHRGAIDAMSRSSVEKLNKLYSLKTALMQDLLTGKKRVSHFLNDNI
jgi:type I restriction enzyme, S subunit